MAVGNPLDAGAETDFPRGSFPKNFPEESFFAFFRQESSFQVGWRASIWQFQDRQIGLQLELTA